jgi:hypothetical protein
MRNLEMTQVRPRRSRRVAVLFGVPDDSGAARKMANCGTSGGRDE